jgi:hypothetical protein
LPALSASRIVLKLGDAVIHEASRHTERSLCAGSLTAQDKVNTFELRTSVRGVDHDVPEQAPQAYAELTGLGGRRSLGISLT